MSDEIKNKVTQLKGQIAEWPIEQRAIFMDGISEGLCIAVLIAEEAGVKLGKDPNFDDLSLYLCRQECPPVKKRDKSVQEPKSARDQLAADIKRFLLRAIACRLRIPKDRFDTSLDVEDMIKKYFHIIVAIANRSALDDAIHDIQIMRSIAGGGLVDRESVKSEVETCHEKFGTEIASVERFNELTKRSNFKLKDVWIYLRSNEHLDLGYEDDELREIDARYQSRE
jgi:hypothetical protein